MIRDNKLISKNHLIEAVRGKNKISLEVTQIGWRVVFPKSLSSRAKDTEVAKTKYFYFPKGTYDSKLNSLKAAIEYRDASLMKIITGLDQS